MPTAHLHPLSVIPKLSRFGRALAGAQALKETMTIIFLGLPMVKAAPLVLLSALPGVVLYLLHWHLALGRAGRVFALAVWALTLVDELWGLLLFKELEEPTLSQIRMMHWSYFLGLGIILTALGELVWRRQVQKARARRNVHHQALLAARHQR